MSFNPEIGVTGVVNVDNQLFVQLEMRHPDTGFAESTLVSYNDLNPEQRVYIQAQWSVKVEEFDQQHIASMERTLNAMENLASEGQSLTAKQQNQLDQLNNTTAMNLKITQQLQLQIFEERKTLEANQKAIDVLSQKFNDTSNTPIPKLIIPKSTLEQTWYYLRDFAHSARSYFTKLYDRQKS